MANHLQVPAPSQATKWLIVVHIESPQHWVLLEVRWQTRQLLFYDSLAATASYALRVKALSLILLELCEGLYTCDLDVAAWTWIGETVSMLSFSSQHASLTCAHSVAFGRQTGTTVDPSSQPTSSPS